MWCDKCQTQVGVVNGECQICNYAETIKQQAEQIRLKHERVRYFENRNTQLATENMNQAEQIKSLEDRLAVYDATDIPETIAESQRLTAALEEIVEYDKDLSNRGQWVACYNDVVEIAEKAIRERGRHES